MCRLFRGSHAVERFRVDCLWSAIMLTNESAVCYTLHSKQMEACKFAEQGDRAMSLMNRRNPSAKLCCIAGASLIV